MKRRIPVTATIVVLAAVAAMVALGFWQLQRAEWKNELIAHYSQAQAMSADVAWPRDSSSMERALFRYSGFDCQRVISNRTSAAKNAAGGSGVSQIARCALPDGSEAEVALGWSRPTDGFAWSGGPVRGMIGPGGEFGGILYAAQQPEGLLPLAQPDPSDLPNNHLAYAGQWFFFALTALVIYVLALRRRASGA